MKKALFATSALAISGFVAGEALAVDVELYGQVNKVMMFADDGQTTDFSVADNDKSSTRFGLKGSQALDNGLTASVLWEMESQDNASNNLTQNWTANQSQTPNSIAVALDTRHARVGLAGDWGAVFLGKQSTATDSVTEQDLAGVADLMGSAYNDIGGGYKYRIETTAAQTTTTINTYATNMDGNGRANAIRYDSPIFNGFQGRISASQGGDIDGAVYYEGKYDAFTVNAAIGMVMEGDQTGSAGIEQNQLDSTLSGSVSVAHDNGIAVTAAYGKRDYENKSSTQDDPTFMYLKAGYAWDMFEVAADYAKNEDVVYDTTEDEQTSYGLGAQYNMGNGVSVAGTYRNFDLEDGTTQYDDINLFAVSMRVKF